jgi:predicted RNase H-like nuclease
MVELPVLTLRASPTTLLVGFDSAWTPSNSGAIVGVLQAGDGTCHELGPPKVVDYHGAEGVILGWQADQQPTATIVMLDQPTIVPNPSGQRPVENLVASPVSLRYGGIQPANTARAAMFGREAPLWTFLARFGGPADPAVAVSGSIVFETYPALAIIALGWTLPDSRAGGRLPKYNPERRKTFAISDWQYLCGRVAGAFRQRGLMGVVQWIEEAARKSSPRKQDQDGLDAYLCLLAALYLAERRDCLMVGNLQTGYILVPYCDGLHAELNARCNVTGRAPASWVRRIRLPAAL